MEHFFLYYFPLYLTANTELNFNVSTHICKSSPNSCCYSKTQSDKFFKFFKIIKII